MQLKNMREFNLNKEAKKIYTPHIINMLNIIHEYKGKQTLYIEAKKVLNIQIKQKALKQQINELKKQLMIKLNLKIEMRRKSLDIEMFQKLFMKIMITFL